MLAFLYSLLYTYNKNQLNEFHVSSCVLSQNRRLLTTSSYRQYDYDKKTTILTSGVTGESGRGGPPAATPSRGDSTKIYFLHLNLVFFF